MRGVLLAALLAAASVSGCSAGTGGYDADRVEREIRDHVAETFPSVRVGRATCPEEIEEGAGAEFECEVNVEGQPLTLAVTQTDDDGHATFEQVEAVLDVAKAEQTIGAALTEQVEAPIEVDCGELDVRVIAVEDTLECLANDDHDNESGIEITVVDIEGHVRYEVTG